MVQKNELYEFIKRAGKATYAGGGKYEEKPERPGFYELVYDKEAPWMYRDSYTGHSRSGGQEVVRLNGEAIWWSGYGGGMVEGKEQLSSQTFKFLKQALSQGSGDFKSFRGPREFTDGSWKYTYSQEGDVTDFYGYEEILFNGEKIFWHRMVGGILNHH